MPQNPVCNETSVLVRLQRPNGLAELFANYRSSLRNTIKPGINPLVRGRVDASDILQETYLVASKRLGNFLVQRPMPFFAWLRLLAHQLLTEAHRMHLRSQRRSVVRENQSNRNFEELSGHQVDPSIMAGNQEQQAIFKRTIASLKERDRRILMMRHIEEKTNVQSAKELGISPAAASKRHLRALERLRLILEKQAIEE